jgi:hypothetical protein
MGGGLLQLVAYGAQDVYLTGNPQITFFKVVYRRHTNFAIEAIEQTPTGNNSLGSRISIQITRNGDLIHRVYFNGKLRNKHASKPMPLVPNFGQRLLKAIELEIGGQRIDKHFSEWLYIWNELSLPAGKRDGYNIMVGADKYNRSMQLAATTSYEVYVPLEFWFCRNVGLALPLIALQYHEVKINIEYENGINMVDKGADNYNNVQDSLASGTAKNNGEEGTFTYQDDLVLEDAKIWVDYIFLDTDERRRFAQLSHEYLIEQLQFTGAEYVDGSASTKSIRMNFNHPCKELIWAIRRDDSIVYWNNFSSALKPGDATKAGNDYMTSKNPVNACKIMLNGNERFGERDGNYFSLVQPFQHHENTPDLFHQGINVYSFALKPEEHQPSGTLNMSRIDTAVLSLSSAVTGNLYIFAVNYNVLRILSGMGGLAYSN